MSTSSSEQQKILYPYRKLFFISLKSKQHQQWVTLFFSCVSSKRCLEMLSTFKDFTLQFLQRIFNLILNFPLEFFSMATNMKTKPSLNLRRIWCDFQFSLCSEGEIKKILSSNVQNKKKTSCKSLMNDTTRKLQSTRSEFTSRHPEALTIRSSTLPSSSQSIGFFSSFSQRVMY